MTKNSEPKNNEPKNKKPKRTFWDYWNTSHLVFGALATLITAITGLIATGIIKIPKDIKAKISIPIVTESPEITPTPTETPIEETPPIEEPIPIEEPVPTLTPTTTPTLKPTPTPIPKIIETDYFKFQLQKCQRTRETVDCSFLITNLTDNFRTIYLYAYDDDRVADSSGNTYNFTKVEIANLYANYNYSVNTPLSPGLPIKANIYLKLPTDINKLAGLEFSYASGDGRRKKLLLRNIPIVGN